MSLNRRVLGLALSVLTGCGASERSSLSGEAQGRRVAAITLPAELDRVLRDYETAWRASDAPALAALFTEDGLVLEPNQLPVRGRNEIARSYGRSGGDLNLAAIAYATADSVGYIIGTFGGADISEHSAKFILALKRDSSGRWLIAADMGQP